MNDGTDSQNFMRKSLNMDSIYLFFPFDKKLTPRECVGCEHVEMDFKGVAIPGRAKGQRLESVGHV